MFIIISDKARAASDSSKNLCLTCWDYRAITYALTDQEERLCVNIPDKALRLRGPVSRCTDYRDKTKPGKYEMDKMAWAIEPSKKRVGFGFESVKFVPPSERKDLKSDS
jgi:hypothetical protein